jgi:hypothetical protein
MAALLGAAALSAMNCETHIDHMKVATVQLSATSLELPKDASRVLNAVIEPNFAENLKVDWTTSDAGVADLTVIGGDGAASVRVTGVGEGDAVITVTTRDGAKTAQAAITVTPPPPFTLKVRNLKAAPTTGTTPDTDEFLTWQGEAWTEAQTDEDGSSHVVTNKESSAQISSEVIDATLVYLSAPVSGPYVWRAKLSIATGGMSAANDDGLFFGVFLNPEDDASAIKLVGVRHGSSGVLRRLFWSGGTNAGRFEATVATPTIPGANSGTLAINTSYVYEISWDGNKTFTNSLTDATTTYVWKITSGTSTGTVHTDLTQAAGSYYPGFMVSAAAVTVEEITISKLQ